MTDSVFPMNPEDLQGLLLDGSLVIALNETHSMLQRLEAKLDVEHGEPTSEREWFTVVEVAERLGKTPFTVREWCRNHRVNASKTGNRGGAGDWRIHRDEILRYENEGLL